MTCPAACDRAARALPRRPRRPLELCDEYQKARRGHLPACLPVPPAAVHAHCQPPRPSPATSPESDPVPVADPAARQDRGDRPGCAAPRPAPGRHGQRQQSVRVHRPPLARRADHLARRAGPAPGPRSEERRQAGRGGGLDRRHPHCHPAPHREGRPAQLLRQTPPARPALPRPDRRAGPADLDIRRPVRPHPRQHRRPPRSHPGPPARRWPRGPWRTWAFAAWTTTYSTL